VFGEAERAQAGERLVQVAEQTLPSSPEIAHDRLVMGEQRPDPPPLALGGSPGNRQPRVGSGSDPEYDDVRLRPDQVDQERLESGGLVNKPGLS